MLERENGPVAQLQVEMFGCLRDNYGFLVHDEAAGFTAAIDAPEAARIDAVLTEKGWRLTHILNTHHHFDHAGGNLELQAKWNCTIVGAKNDAARIPGINREVADGEVLDLGGHAVEVIDVSGHTRGHIAYHFRDDGILFSGDALFALGCGRLFEGSAEQMWDSLQRLMQLPDDTRIYCAHEYTQANARFALSVEPCNAALTARSAEIDRLRAEGKPTVPTTLAEEKRTNPFLRPSSEEIQRSVGKVGAPLVEVFAETRKRKDQF